jgi:uncharacterized membrane protein
MNKTVFRGADPAGTGQAGLTNFVKCKNGLHHCVPLVALIKKTYMVRLVWNLKELIIIFGRFSAPDSHQNRPAVRPVCLAMWLSSPHELVL